MFNLKGFNPGLNITATENPLGFEYGEDIFSPKTELRKIDDIRLSLKDPKCTGPEIVYAIAMNVGKKVDQTAIESRNLLYGVVTYTQGRLGQEPIRSQGHIHAISASCACSTPEVYEIWCGRAIIYMQEFAHDQIHDSPGRCFAVAAQAGDVVIVPPRWAHATISADPHQALSFGAWCVKDFGFDYLGVRRHKGLAWFPKLSAEDIIKWHPNDLYTKSELIEKPPRIYTEFGIDPKLPIYTQFEKNNDLFLFVKDPASVAKLWLNFVP